VAGAIRFVFRWAILLLVFVLLAIILFAALNWTMATNMAAARGKLNRDTAHLSPVQQVKGCGVRPVPVASESPIDPDALAKMQAFSDARGGLGLIVMHDGKIVHQQYAKGITGATPTQTHSMNKNVTALVAGVALGDGTLASADAPLGSIIPEWAKDARGKITLRQLLGMASGLENYSMVQGDWPALKMILSDEIEETALAAPSVRPPGQFRYNNGDSQRAGAVLRRAIAAKHGGESYATYLSRTLWCGVGNAPATLWAESATGAPRFFAGLQAGLEDWARLGQLILDQGQAGGKQVVPAAWIAQMTTPGPNPNYGLSLWLGAPADGTREYSPEAGNPVRHSAPYAAPDVLFFDGFGGQRVYIVPSAKLVVARTGEMDMDWDDAPLVNFALAGLKAAPKSLPPSP
jgi:CubicO group peptidase (beta-lactamase class C family)